MRRDYMSVHNKQPHGWGITELLLAVHSGQCDTVRELLEAGIDVNAANAYGMTPLMAAAMGNHADIARLLCEAGADPESRNRSGLRASEIASWHDANAVVEVLENYTRTIGEEN